MFRGNVEDVLEWHFPPRAATFSIRLEELLGIFVPWLAHQLTHVGEPLMHCLLLTDPAALSS